ncbi:MAG TPA: HD domain-containing protein [Rhabdochlamydiaceae bacterium]|nr:HD domain-containing protein [Rhabdochlamydiaceae bacterium]
MKNFGRICTVVLCFVQTVLFGRIIETFYGQIAVDEEIILDLLDSPPLNRLKKVRQYGVSYYTNYRENYTRYDHSLGVFAILRMKGASLEAQIAGLLHDVSHTAFSHVGDWIFNFIATKDAYQDSIHEWFFHQYGIDPILKKHGFSTKQVLHKSGRFPALEQDLPNLCADRIDYNLQGAYYRNGFLTKEEIMEILEDLQFDGQKWISTKPELMKKMTRFSLMMTKECWGSAGNYCTSKWLADALLKAWEQGLIHSEDIHFGTDDILWTKLNSLEDPYIRDRMHWIKHSEEYYHLVNIEEAQIHARMKFRGIDPWIKLNNQIKHLSDIDPEIANEFTQMKQFMDAGWGITMISN